METYGAFARPEAPEPEAETEEEEAAAEPAEASPEDTSREHRMRHSIHSFGDSSSSSSATHTCEPVSQTADPAGGTAVEREPTFVLGPSVLALALLELLVIVMSLEHVAVRVFDGHALASGVGGLGDPRVFCDGLLAIVGDLRQGREGRIAGGGAKVGMGGCASECVAGGR